jgi:hypothetical protein
MPRAEPISAATSAISTASNAGIGGVQAGQAVHQRGLAGAGRAHDGGELAAMERHVHIFQGVDAGIARAVGLFWACVAAAAVQLAELFEVPEASDCSMLVVILQRYKPRTPSGSAPGLVFCHAVSYPGLRSQLIEHSGRSGQV